MNASYYTFHVTKFIRIVDRDLQGCRSVTNDIARIIKNDLASILSPDKRLIYRDSMGRWDEVKLSFARGIGCFGGFAPVDNRLASSLDLLTPAFCGDPSDKDLLAMGYERPFKVLPYGRVAALQTINSRLVAIVVDVHAYGHTDAFYYRSRDAARQALEKWDGTNEPQHWIRHPQSGRRRDNGDAAQEYFQP
ncbi:hypothetical protein [Caballeronia zhejiangensis]|uniref:hypothetical protein n=1 Tax=Caballeronia zhejiangensis TaxID=871203 RepID=UPI00158E6BC3|nr:hypothetical protein [Caballeronia zhejiangensis]MCG7402990.1 hypothetical protein [Caballeronia zhejiangensis]MCI1043815.1 hypothetical protein [Caballeronia zhejiangensis]